MKPDVFLATPFITPPILAAMDELFTVHRAFSEFGVSPNATALPVGAASRIRGLVTDPPRGADRTLIEALPQLEIIACQGVGVDAIDVALAKSRGIAVTNTPDVLTIDVADLAIGLMLAASRRIVLADRFVRERRWLKEVWPLGRRATGKTLGIVGLGRIGRAVAARAAAFSMQVLYTGPRPKPDAPYEYVAGLAALAERSDFLVLACSGGPTTQNLVSAPILEALGPEGILINVARGSVVDEVELIEALRSGKLGFAALDAFADEPRAPEALFAMPNVIVQPHQGSATVETREHMGRLVLDNLIAKFEKKPLPTPVGS